MENLKSVQKTINNQLRYVIINTQTNVVVDDAQGYGYKTYEKSNKALWYKYKGGETKMNQDEKDAKVFFKENPTFEKIISSTYLSFFKELSRDEITNKEIQNIINEECGVKIPTNYYKYAK